MWRVRRPSHGPSPLLFVCESLLLDPLAQVATALLAEFVNHSLDDKPLLKELIKFLLPRVADPIDKVRKQVIFTRSEPALTRSHPLSPALTRSHPLSPAHTRSHPFSP
jgi:hypothetical protein